MKARGSQTCRWAAISFAAAALLVACGGGDDENTPTPATAQVPESASQSVDGFIAYLKLLVVSQFADGLEPVDTSMVTAPADDATENTIEPVPVP